jgi:hypothetical protein
MSYTTEVIDNGKGILHIGSGTVSGKDLIASATNALKLVQEGLSPRYGLTDLTCVREFAVSTSEIEMNAKLNTDIARLLPSFKLAIVAPLDNIYGMVRMWQAHMDKTEWRSQVFRCKEEALAWLGQEIGR